MANLTYRQATQEAPVSTTTKNAALTSQEIDGNFKSLNDELITKAPLVSPGLSGVPTAPTATAGTNTTQLATTAFVQTGLSSRQPLDATLTALAGVTTAANQLIYATGSDAFATTSLTSFGRSIIDDTDAPTARTTLGLGTAAVQSDDRYVHRSNNLSDLANVATARSNLGLGNVDNTSDVNKSVARAAQLTTARSINGTDFNGTQNITTNSWGTSRTLTIGSTGKSVNGSADASWSLTEIGAAAASHTHDASAIISGVINIARLPDASTEVKGVVQLSSAVNSTSTALAATPSAVKAAYDAAMGDAAVWMASNGYVKLRSGVIIQWGVAVASDPGTTVTFPVAFPTACTAVTATYGQTGDKISLGVHTFTTTTFKLYGWGYNTYWIAVGY